MKEEEEMKACEHGGLGEEGKKSANNSVGGVDKW